MATTAGQFWDKHVRDAGDRVNWWSSDACTATYNGQVCGQAVPGNSRGCRIALAAAAGVCSTRLRIRCGRAHLAAKPRPACCVEHE